MPKDRFVAVLALLAAAVLIPAGCGGGPSKDEFAADLDKVCKRTNAKIQKLRAPRTIKGIGEFARKSRGVLEESIREAQDLELPDEKGKEFKAYISSSRDSLGALDEMERAAADNDGRAIRRVFAKTTEQNKKRDAQAKKLGLKQCGVGTRPAKRSPAVG